MSTTSQEWMKLFTIVYLSSLYITGWLFTWNFYNWGTCSNPMWIARSLVSRRVLEQILQTFPSFPYTFNNRSLKCSSIKWILISGCGRGSMLQCLHENRSCSKRWESVDLSFSEFLVAFVCFFLCLFKLDLLLNALSHRSQVYDPSPAFQENPLSCDPVCLSKLLFCWNFLSHWLHS